MLMSFNSKDLMVSILPSQNAATACPEFTIPPTGCADDISAAFQSGEPDGLPLLQRQLRMALGHLSV
jgi:hypothetical protein